MRGWTPLAASSLPCWCQGFLAVSEGMKNADTVKSTVIIRGIRWDCLIHDGTTKNPRSFAPRGFMVLDETGWN